MGYLRLEMLATPNRICPAAIYILLASFDYPRMECTENIYHTRWNLLKSWAFSDGIHTSSSTCCRFYILSYLQCGASEEMGYPGMESRMKPRTAAIDEMGICRRYCHTSLYNNIHFIILYEGSFIDLNYSPIYFPLINPSSKYRSILK
jgi:hypothetical protein